MPRMNRPSLTKSRPAAVWAMSAGVRVKIGRMADPIWMVSVVAAR